MFLQKCHQHGLTGSAVCPVVPQFWNPWNCLCPMQGQLLVSSHQGHPHSSLLPAPGHRHPTQLLCKCAVNPACPKCTKFQHSSSLTLQSICDCMCPTCSETECRSGVAWPRLIASQRLFCPSFPRLQLHNSLALACLTA